MRIGFIGLGKMGLEMAARATKAGHDLIGYDIVQKASEKAKERKIKTVATLEELLATLEKPRTIWLQVPPGKRTNDIIGLLEKLVDVGDTIIDGGNSDFRDSLKTAKILQEKQINFMDVGVSGGVAGARNGCGLLVGGTTEQYNQMIPFFEALAAPGGYSYCGGVGAGHFAKTIHNGVEYALMQAYAEGYEMLAASEIDIDIISVLSAYQNGCSIRSHILEKMIEALKPDSKLTGVEGFVADSGMGRWTVEEAMRLKVPTPTISAALQARFRSQQKDSPAMQCLAALRGTIGGHPVKYKRGN
ncbi:MAG TPA: decarboxylating 6-phosphogluconate dehydrogenase [Selenomonadales bacterium]|nr:decarboxylating 6-phosphogluconate dehydrogenase [Selenomonadales bacterium]